MMRPVISPGSSSSSRRNRESGNSGVRSSKRTRAARFVGGHPVDHVDAHECGVLLARGGRTGRAPHVVALAQAEAAHLGGGHVRVVATREVPADAQEPVSLVAQVQETFDVDEIT